MPVQSSSVKIHHYSPPLWWITLDELHRSSSFRGNNGEIDFLLGYVMTYRNFCLHPNPLKTKHRHRIEQWMGYPVVQFISVFCMKLVIEQSPAIVIIISGVVDPIYFISLNPKILFVNIWNNVFFPKIHLLNSVSRNLYKNYAYSP